MSIETESMATSPATESEAPVEVIVDVKPANSLPQPSTPPAPYNDLSSLQMQESYVQQNEAPVSQQQQIGAYQIPQISEPPASSSSIPLFQISPSPGLSGSHGSQPMYQMPLPPQAASQSLSGQAIYHHHLAISPPAPIRPIYQLEPSQYKSPIAAGNSGNSEQKNVVSDGQDDPEHSRWTEQATICLVEAKRREAEEFRRTGTRLKAVSAERRWNSIADCLMKHGFRKNGVKCRQKWENLHKEYRRIADHEIQQAGQGHPSYWQMDTRQRKNAKLPSHFPETIYHAMDAILGTRAMFGVEVLPETGNEVSPSANSADENVENIKKRKRKENIGLASVLRATMEQQSQILEAQVTCMRDAETLRDKRQDKVVSANQQNIARIIESGERNAEKIASAILKIAEAMLNGEKSAMQ